MLILIGVAPTAYALNRAPPEGHADAVHRRRARAPRRSSRRTAAGYNVIGDPRPAVTDYVHAHKISEGTYPSLAVLVKQISDQVDQYGSVAKTPLDKVQNVRNDMYLASEALRVLTKDKESELTRRREETDRRVQEGARLLDQVHPDLGEDLRRDRARPRHDGRLEAHRRHGRREDRQDPPHLRPGRGGRAVAAATIGAADGFGLPVSTTHVLSSGVAGTMVANGSGMQWSTIEQHRDGLGVDAAGGDDPVGDAVRHLPRRSSEGGRTGRALSKVARPVFSQVPPYQRDRPVADARDADVARLQVGEREVHHRRHQRVRIGVVLIEDRQAEVLQDAQESEGRPAFRVARRRTFARSRARRPRSAGSAVRCRSVGARAC